MKLLIVSRYDRSARAISAIVNYVRVGKASGHEVALFSDPIADQQGVRWHRRRRRRRTFEAVRVRGFAERRFGGTAARLSFAIWLFQRGRGSVRA